MSYVLVPDKSFDFSQDFDSTHVSEVLICLNDFSKKAYFESSELKKISSYFKNLGLKVVLDFDALVLNENFGSLIDRFKVLDSTLFDSVRAQDFGVIEYLFCETDFSLQLNLETGHHNLLAIESWINYLGQRLEKVILSYELPKDSVSKFAQKLKNHSIKAEILGLGKILLFYSPRKLLSRLDESFEDFALAHSLESPHKGFKVYENIHGSFMYHLKDLCLFDFTTFLDENFIEMRVELSEELLWPLKLCKKHVQSNPQSYTQGYFKVNKSDILFNKLKNQHLLKNDETYIGEVIEAKKGEYLAVLCNGSVEAALGASVSLISPEGLKKDFIMQSAQDANFNELAHFIEGKIVLLPYIKKMGPRSILSLDK